MEIIISRSSWHYRMTQWSWSHFGKEPSSSLCGYFWQTVFSPVIVLCFYVVLLIAVSALALFAFYLCGAFLCNFLHWINILPATFDIVPGEFNWRHLVISVVIDAVIFVLMYYKNHKNHDSVFIEYIKAKKNKICPFIVYKD